MSGCCSTSGGSVQVVDGATNRVVASVDLGDKTNPNQIAVNAVTHRVYVSMDGPNYPSGHTVAIIDGTTNAVITMVTVGTFPDGVAVDSSTNKICVANFSSNNVSVIDGASNRVIETISVGQQPAGAAINPTTQRLYVTNRSDGTVWVIAV